MKNAVKKSWKTTLGGVLLAAAPIVMGLGAEWATPVSTILGAVGALLLGGSARDNNVSSEEAKSE